MTLDWASAGAGRTRFDPHRGALVLGRVESVEDREGLARVEVSFPLHADDDRMKSTAWAPVALPFAGANYGALTIPNVHDIVVLGFLSNDPRAPVVLGSVWHGGATPKETIPGAEVDRWVLTGRQGTEISIVEGGGAPVITLKTPGGVSVTVSDRNGGEIEARTGGSTLKLTPSEVSINTTTMTITATDLTINAPSTTVNAAQATFSSLISCNVAQSTTTIAATYTTGAGNVL